MTASVTASTLEALKRVKASGRKLVLATGRELPDLLRVFPETSLFDLAVVENGALLYNPATGEKRLLAEAPPAAFVEELRRRGVLPLSVGESIVATWHPHETTVLEVIRTLGLEMQVIFNKEAVMILPFGRQQGDRRAGGAGGAGTFHAQRSGCGRRRERSRFFGNLRMQRSGWQRPAGFERARRCGDGKNSRRGRGRNHRAIAGRRFAQPATALEAPRHSAGPHGQRRRILPGAVRDAGGGGGAVGRRKVDGGYRDCGAADSKAISGVRD